MENFVWRIQRLFFGAASGHFWRRAFSFAVDAVIRHVRGVVVGRTKTRVVFARARGLDDCRRQLVVRRVGARGVGGVERAARGALTPVQDWI